MYVCIYVGKCMHLYANKNALICSFIHSFIHSFRCFVYSIAYFLLSLSFHSVFILFAVIYNRLHILDTNIVFVVKYCVLFSI